MGKEFLSIYNELHKYLKRRFNYNGNSHTELISIAVKNSSYLKQYEDKLKLYANLRNVIVHETLYNGEHIAEPHVIVVEEYKKIKDYILNPPKALSIAIPSNQIYKADIDQNALEVIKVMNENSYTHVPITEKEKFIDIFSENTIFSSITSNGEIMLDKNTCIREFNDYLSIDNHSSESFEFIKKSTYVYEVEELFQRLFAQNKRLSAVFITEKGNPEEKILGMITAWDIAGMV